MPITNRIITRGMGRSRGVVGRAGMVTQGYGGIFRAVVTVARTAVRLGQSGAKRAIRELEEIVVGAKLIRVNEKRPESDIQGFITVRVDVARRIAVVAENLTKRVRKSWEDIKITIKRIR